MGREILNMEKLAIFGGKPVLKKPLPKYNSIGKEELNAATRVVKGKILSDFVGRVGPYFLGGEYVKEMEKKFCKYFGVRYAVSFNSASSALQAAVAALGVGPGDEVITTPYTMSATASAILYNNALPVFADISEENFCIDPEKIKSLVNSKTKAIIAVNLFGGPADYNAILKIAKDYNLKVIEDNAQSAGAKYNKKFTGTIGDIGVFSLNVHKVIQSGEGGVLVTNNPKYAFRAQLARNHGEAVMDEVEEKLYEPILGNNYRMAELQAAIGIEQLKKLNRLNAQRLSLVKYLDKKIKQFKWLSAMENPDGNTNVYYVYPIKFIGQKIGIKRGTFVKAMQAEGFPLNEGYQKPLYLFPAYQRKEIYPHSKFPFESAEYPHSISYKKGICPVAEKMYEEFLLCTNICQPPVSKKEIDLFIKALSKIEGGLKELKQYEKKQ